MVLSVGAGFVDYSSFGDATDAGMSCAWNSSGTCLASASQDGSLTIWDPRAHRVALSQTLETAALRSCAAESVPFRHQHLLAAMIYCAVGYGHESGTESSLCFSSCHEMLLFLWVWVQQERLTLRLTGVSVGLCRGWPSCRPLGRSPG